MIPVTGAGEAVTDAGEAVTGAGGDPVTGAGSDPVTGAGVARSLVLGVAQVPTGRLSADDDTIQLQEVTQASPAPFHHPHFFKSPRHEHPNASRSP